MSNRKIALVKQDKNTTLQDWYSWCDGLYGALKVMAEDNNVQVFGYNQTPTSFERDNIKFSLSPVNVGVERFNPDIVFAWGSSSHSWEELNGLNTKRVLLYAGGEPNRENAELLFDEVVVENDSDAKFFNTKHVAFGTNTDVFKPMKLNKLFPCFYPASFALWKRHHLWSKSVPAGSLAVGQWQEHEKECYEDTIKDNHIVLPAMPMTIMPYLYNQSVGVCLTPERMGGCQRAALEAMACNIPVLVTNDSKASEFEGVWSCPADKENIRQAYLNMVTSFEMEKPNLREKFIVGKYDHFVYAKKLLELC